MYLVYDVCISFKHYHTCIACVQRVVDTFSILMNGCTPGGFYTKPSHARYSEEGFVNPGGAKLN
jgi:hypothetical protein